MVYNRKNVLNDGCDGVDSSFFKNALLTFAIFGVLGSEMQAQDDSDMLHKRLDLTTVTDNKFGTSPADSVAYAQILDPKFDKMDYIYDENYLPMIRGIERELSVAYFLEDMMGVKDSVNVKNDSVTYVSRSEATLKKYKALSAKLTGFTKNIAQLRSVALTRDNVNHFLASYKSKHTDSKIAAAETLQNIKGDLDVIMLYLGWFVYETSYMSKQTMGDSAYMAKTTTDPRNFLNTRSLDQYLDDMQGFQGGATPQEMIEGLESFLDASNSREALAYFFGKMMTDVKDAADGSDTDAYIAALNRLEQYVHRSVDFDIIMGEDKRQGLKNILLNSLPSLSGSDKMYVRNLIRDLNSRNKTQAFADEINTKDRNQALIETAVQKEDLKKKKTYDYFDHMDQLQYISDENPIHSILREQLKNYDRDTLNLHSLHTIDMKDPGTFFQIIANNRKIHTVSIDMGTIQERIEQLYVDDKTAGSKVFAHMMSQASVLAKKEHLTFYADYNGFGRSFVEKSDMTGALHKERHPPYMHMFVSSANKYVRRDHRFVYSTDGVVHRDLEVLANLQSSIDLPHLQQWPLDLDTSRERCETFDKSHRRGGGLGLGVYDISNDLLLLMAKIFNKRIVVYLPNITAPSPELQDIANISKDNGGPVFVFGDVCGDYTHPSK